MVGGIDHGVLESTWVLQTQMKLALLGLVCLLGCGANVGLESIKTKGHDLEMVRM